MRLAHRIMWLGFSGPPDNPRDEDAARFRADVLKYIQPSTPVLIANNVAQYYADQKKQAWSLAEDFPSVRPPFDALFIEWDWPTGTGAYATIASLLTQTDGPTGLIGGTLVRTMGFPDYQTMFEKFSASAANSPHVKTVSKAMRECNLAERATHVVRLDNCMWWPAVTRPVYLEDSCQLFLGPDGEVIWMLLTAGRWRMKSPDFDAEKLQEIMGWEFHVPMLTLAFLNFKNAIQEDVSVQEKPSDKWLRRMKQPALTYKILNIEPTKKVLRVEGDVKHNGLKKALYICRGHFVNYTAERPLFGRLVGRFWRTAHTRGSSEQGVVVKDYAVSPPSGGSSAPSNPGETIT